MLTWFLVVLLVGGFYPRIWLLKNRKAEYAYRFIRSMFIAGAVQLLYRAIVGDALWADDGVPLAHYTRAIAVILGIQVLIAHWSRADLELNFFESEAARGYELKGAKQEILCYGLLLWPAVIIALFTNVPGLFDAAQYAHYLPW